LRKKGEIQRDDNNKSFYSEKYAREKNIRLVHAAQHAKLHLQHVNISQPNNNRNIALNSKVAGEIKRKGTYQTHYLSLKFLLW